MELAMGALCCLLPKLYDLLKEEYNLQKGVKKNIKFLSKELESTHAALCKVAQVPIDQLDEQAAASLPIPTCSEKFGKMAINLFKKDLQIAHKVDEIKAQVQDVADRRDRNDRELVGVQEARDELIQMLTAEGINVSKKQKLKTISIVGFGGLGKTTLAKAVYDRLRTNFDCRAFIAAGRNPDLKKVFRDILIDIDKQKYMDVNVTVLDKRQLINELRELLHNKSCDAVALDNHQYAAVRLMINLASGGIVMTRRSIVKADAAASPHGFTNLFAMQHQSGCAELQIVRADIVPLSIEGSRKRACTWRHLKAMKADAGTSLKK
ncbi:hypothetical protein PR202_gn00802 [Eleusine coracana subsp. coracana]|uniref:Uncharacterized protein n=1 Tax=Eleusine coracana subsp. coracana TaxID=191504 RepID=A0AAV5G0G3_ELECO|nr:hypothetical protein PR202_gn00802 [Eleusine coracana subsp. coracana]